MEYPGNFIELSSTEKIAKEKALENKLKFKLAIKENKKKIMQSLSQRPTLIQRYMMEKKTNETKSNALISVVNNVFQNNSSIMEGIFTQDEQDLIDVVNSIQKNNSKSTIDNKNNF